MGNQPPLSMALQSARMEMLRAANSVMLTYKLPPCLMDCVVSALLADIRAQVSSELVKDIQNSANKDGMESVPIEDTGAQSSSGSVRDIQNSAKDGETENE